jgi:hypothetical protein
MKSPFATLFLQLQDRIANTVTDIKYIDQDLGQLDVKTRPPVSWPCVLIDFENFRFKNLGENVQTAKGTVVLRLGFAPHSNSSSITPEQYRTQALRYYDLEWLLHCSIQGWSPGGEFGSMARSSAVTQDRADGYRVRELRYKIAFEDYSTKWEQQYAPATMIVSDQVDL